MVRVGIKEIGCVWAVLACACATGESVEPQSDAGRDAGGILMLVNADDVPVAADASTDEGTDAVVDVGRPTLPGCDPVASGAVIEGAHPLLPDQPFTVLVHMPQPWVYVGLAVHGTNGTPSAHTVEVVQGGGFWTWSFAVGATHAGLYCATFTTDNGATVRQRAVIDIEP